MYCSCLKSAPRYEFLILLSYYLQTLGLREQGCEDVWLFSDAKRNPRAKMLGKHWYRPVTVICRMFSSCSKSIFEKTGKRVSSHTKCSESQVNFDAEWNFVMMWVWLLLCVSFSDLMHGLLVIRIHQDVSNTMITDFLELYKFKDRLTQFDLAVVTCITWKPLQEHYRDLRICFSN